MRRNVACSRSLLLAFSALIVPATAVSGAPLPDLAITVDDGTSEAVPGLSTTYTIDVANESSVGRLFGLGHHGAGPNGPSTLYLVDPATGAATAIGPVGFERCTGMDFDAAGELFATCERSDGSDVNVLVKIETTTGAVTEIGPTGVEGLGFGDTVTEISFRHGDGALYAYLETDDGLGTIDPMTGAATALGPTGVDCCGNSIVFTAADTLLHTNEDDLHTLDQATGAASVVAPLTFDPPQTQIPRINGMDFDPLTGTLYGSINVKDTDPSTPDTLLGTIDPVTGLVTIVGPTVKGLAAIAFEPIGGSDVIGATVSDVFPATLSCTWTCVPAGGASCTAGPVAGDIADTVDLPLDEHVTYTAVCDIDPSATGSLVNTATVTVPAGVSDPDPSNDSASDTDTLTQVADLSVTVTDSQDPAAAGDPLSYTVTVHNAGPSDAALVVATDTLPAGVSVIATDGCLDDPGGVPSCDLGTVPAGGSAIYRIDATVGGSTPSGIVTNGVSVASAASDPDPSDDSGDEDTLIDADAPIVTLIDSAADTGDGMLAACEEAKVAITQLLVRFSEAIPNAADPANYRLLAAGSDGSFSTAGCGPPLGDDQPVAIDAVSYDPGTATATLDVHGGTPLGDSIYRLLVCDTIRDVAGNALDGDLDGMRGDDFLHTYRVDRGNLFANGHFDCALDHWIAVRTVPEEIVHSAEDVQGSSVSGSASVINLSASTAFALAQCPAVTESTPYTSSSRLRLQVAPGVSLTAHQRCEFYSAPLCAGTLLVSDSAAAAVSDTGGEWQALSEEWFTPRGAASALCSFDLIAPGGESFDAHVDDLSLARSVITIFADSFELGDTAAWLLTVP